MLNLLEKYADKIISQYLAEPSDICFLALDDEIYSLKGSRSERLFVETRCKIQGARGSGKNVELSLKQVFDLMNINSILYVIPSEPYRSIIQSLLKWGTTNSKIIPQDCETRTFFHDIPVIDEPSPDKISQALSERKSAIISEGPAIVSYGSVSPEQASVSFSSTCFSTFVKYFYDHLTYLDECRERNDVPVSERLKEFGSIVSLLDMDYSTAQLAKGPPQEREEIMEMLSEAGKRVVEERLVDSFFGNISYFSGKEIFISETAASLDELQSSIDIVPLDGSSSVGITASSEVSTHRKVFENTKARVILHGHPKFSVIMSMYCNKDCDSRDECHKACPEQRSICETPIVPGEIGTGPTGIVNTVPEAFELSDAVIVHGHGVFCIGSKDFNEPFKKMMGIEECCKTKYFNIVSALL